ncbi:MAG TPA: 2-C-methyl-D-erythritol 4-phosphate cytidylyltransferase [Pseudonocardiaceae bacterium]|nr:2-C-methyl-D-erythritol 4-phosphate cytidylyltransferase [Pseudonocardiaceae bacterium]
MAQPESTERVAPDRLAAGVVLASGSGTRVGGEINKVYLPMAGRRVVGWSLAALGHVAGELVLVIRPQDKALADEVLADPALAGVSVAVTHGGATRQESELRALRLLAGRIQAGAVDTVLIHDAARPLVTPELAGAVLRAARECGGAIPGLPRTDLVRVDAAGAVAEADLGRVVTVQTPQGYRAAPLLAAYQQAAADGFVGTDTAACMARYSGIPTRCIPGDVHNMKITYPYDVAIATRLLARDTARHDVDGLRGVRLHR